MEKQCWRCGIVKRITRFKCDKRTPDGRTKTCRDCYINNKVEKFVKTPEMIEAHRAKMTGRKHSEEWRMNQSRGALRALEKGIGNFKKQGSTDPDHYRMRAEYQIWRDKVFELKGRKCETCGSDKRLHVHHLKCYYDFPELRIDISNGQVLCISCHMKLTYKEKKLRNKLL